jgi:hypothetical protein
MADKEDLQPHLPDLSDPEQRFEKQDVNIWAIGKVGIGLILTTIISLFLVLGVFRYLEQQDRASQPKLPAGVEAPLHKLPPEPRLLVNEPDDLKEVRASEEQALHGYGWADPQHTRVRIPIDKAIDDVVQRGLPARTNSDQGVAASVSVPTESSLGPKMQQPGGPLAPQLERNQGK